MYEYDEYFDEDLKLKPYNSSEEELSDYLKIVDMILENLLEHRGIQSESRLFSKGLVITEAELKAYYGLPPALRVLDQCDPLLSVSVRKAFDYIDKRTENTGRLLPYLRISAIRIKFELNMTELLAVLLSLYSYTDRRSERILGFLQDDITRKEPTLGLLLTIVKRLNTGFDKTKNIYNLLNDRFLRLFFKSSEEEGAGFPFILNETMAGQLLGDGKEINGISPEAFVYEEETDIPLFFEKESDLIKGILRSYEKGHFYIENDDHDTVEHILFNCAFQTGKRLFVLNLEKILMEESQKVDSILTSLEIYMKVEQAALGVLCRFSKNGPDSEKEKSLEKNAKERLLKRITDAFSQNLVFFYGEETEPYELSVMSIPAINIEFPSANKRILIWNYFVEKDKEIQISEDVCIPDFADCHELSYGKIKRICAHAKETAKLLGSRIITKDLLLDSMMKINNVDFSSLAGRVKAVYTWDDLTIADDQADILRVACNRYKVKNRVSESLGLKKKNAYGNGVSILLYGPPGTGKTMAAQVIANELSLPLYRIDISRIFSKYIGETEKNLSEIFNAAKGANVILFFDEADALFSKRTEIRDSNDKYSNSETAYLLQKIEEYDGMSILATNYFQNFDNAFIRRITYVAHLDSPDEEQRYLLWTTILPAEAEIEKGTDFRFLANQFELSGSNIKAILYSAAYMAGAENKPLGMRHIARAMQYEFKKLGRLTSSGELGMLMGYL
ncbi:ATP-binding protein [Butyrivibrio sp. AE3004]|uniref:ATP-binding protein n=1 Tax=Butyrivibrio sp. AE3004 TaxID=1506994 RepID=UPI000493E58A|nr:AAA family ATPase [Butyrivibrio sp. AE3004]